MFEDIRDVGNGGLLVDELGYLQPREEPLQLIVGLPRDFPYQLEWGNSLPITASVCSRSFCAGRSRSMREACTACTVDGI